LLLVPGSSAPSHHQFQWVKRYFPLTNRCIYIIYGGWGGIRTHDTVSRIHTFQACAFDRSATHPSCRALGLWAGVGRRRLDQFRRRRNRCLSTLLPMRQAGGLLPRRFCLIIRTGQGGARRGVKMIRFLMVLALAGLVAASGISDAHAAAAPPSDTSAQPPPAASGETAPHDAVAPCCRTATCGR
jgi:hypothetical protein